MEGGWRGGGLGRRSSWTERALSCLDVGGLGGRLGAIVCGCKGMPWAEKE